MKKAYIAGKITGCENFKENFKKGKEKVKSMGYIVLNPAELPPGMEYDDYMHICYSMIDVADKVFFLPNWKDSKGAKLELEYANSKGKETNLEKLKGVDC